MISEVTKDWQTGTCTCRRYLYLVLLSPGAGITLFVSISYDITACLSFFFFFSLCEKLCSNIDLSPAQREVFFQCFARLNEVGKVGR